MRRFVGVATVSLCLLLVLTTFPTARAISTIDPGNTADVLLFEEAFIPSSGDPPHPGAHELPALPDNGWISTVPGSGTIEIRTDCGARESVIPGTDIQCLFVRETANGGVTYLTSENISKPSNDFTWGFRVYVDSFRNALAVRRMAIIGSQDRTYASGNYIGITIEDDGRVLALSNLGPQYTGFDLVEDEWYLFRIVMSGLTQKIYVNETDFSAYNTIWVPPENTDLIDTRTVAGAWTGFSQWSIEVSTGGGGIFSPTEFDVGLVNIESEPDEEACLFSRYEYTLLTNSGDNSYAFLGILTPGFFDDIGDEFPGAPKSKTFARVGGPSAIGTVDLGVHAVNNAGGRNQTWSVNVENCGFGEAGLSWLQNYGAAWVIFLAFLVIGVVIVRTLWKGARGEIKGRRR